MGISISWPIGGSHTVETSSYAGEIQAAFYGFDTDRFLKSLVSVFYREMGMGISKRAPATITPVLCNMCIRLTR